MRTSLVFLIFVIAACQSEKPASKMVVLISANAEWRVVKSVYPGENYQTTPWGEYFRKDLTTPHGNESVIFFHEGWGKVAAAGATQYAIDRWNPDVFINLGTCGGFEGSVERFQTLLINRTVIYDIQEAMGDSQEAIQDYTTEIDLSWLHYPDSITATVLVSADRDLVPAEIEELKQSYGAIAGDWETGAIAYTCKRNKKKLLVLRGVTDLVNATGGEAYGKPDVFINGTETVMKKLLGEFPLWAAAIAQD